MAAQNLPILRGIMEFLQKPLHLHKMPHGQIFSVQCFRCAAIINATLPPTTESVHILQCGNCGMPGIAFGGALLPISEEVMESEDPEKKRKHLVGVLMKAIYEELLPLIVTIVGTEAKPCSECGQLHSAPPGEISSEEIFQAMRGRASNAPSSQTKTTHEYTREEAQQIQDAYITLGLMSKKNPDDEQLKTQLKQHRQLVDKIKHLL